MLILIILAIVAIGVGLFLGRKGIGIAVLIVVGMILHTGATQAEDDTWIRLDIAKRWTFIGDRAIRTNRPGKNWGPFILSPDLNPTQSARTRTDISCKEGERLCYGAWMPLSPIGYWGMGKEGDKSCTQCCYVCDGRESFITLNGN